MPTITDTLTQLGQDFRDGIAAVRGLRTDIVAYFDSKKTEVTTIINNFVGRPPIQEIWVDPVNGDDSRDGASAATSKRSIDTVLDSIGTTATRIYLLADTTIRRRRNLYPSLTIVGVQPSGAAPFFTLANRTISFLGTAENSPTPGAGSFSSGFWLFGNAITTQYISFNVPDGVPGQNYTPHIFSENGGSLNLSSGVLSATAAASPLIGSVSTRINVYSSLTLGPGAAGHFFFGVSAGQNPNALYAYATNVTSA